MGRKLTLAEVQKLELEMLIAFDKVCKEHNLYYTLCGGTLLGAVRHHGFIPWDDDIDVMMPRPEYDRFCKLINDGKIILPEPLKTVSSFTNAEVYVPFTKIVNERTLVSEEYMVSDKHLWIDIFVDDGCPENHLVLSMMYTIQRMLRWVLVNKQTKPNTGKTRLKATLKNITRVIVKPISAQWVCRMLEKLALSYDFDRCKSIACIQWGYGPQEKVNKDAWLKPLEIEFEDKLFPIPSNYDEYLKNLYGDYMTLPPEEKRTTHNMNVELL